MVLREARRQAFCETQEHVGTVWGPFLNGWFIFKCVNTHTFHPFSQSPAVTSSFRDQIMCFILRSDSVFRTLEAKQRRKSKCILLKFLWKQPCLLLPILNPTSFYSCASFGENSKSKQHYSRYCVASWEMFIILHFNKHFQRVLNGINKKQPEIFCCSQNNFVVNRNKRQQELGAARYYGNGLSKSQESALRHWIEENIWIRFSAKRHQYPGCVGLQTWAMHGEVWVEMFRPPPTCACVS